MLDDTWVELETTCCKAIATAWVATVKYRHIVFLCHFVDGVEEQHKVSLGVNVLFAVGRKENVLAFLKTETLVNIACLYLCEVVVQHFCHGRTSDVGTFLGQPAVGKVATGVFRVCHVHIGNNVNDTTVGLLGQTFVLTAVSCFHMEDRNMQTLGSDDAKAGVGVAENQYAVGLSLDEEFVRAVDDIATSRTEVIAYGIHIHFGFGELQVAEEDAVEVVIVVLACMGENDVKVLAALIDDGGETDNLGTGANNDYQLQLAIVLELYI